MRIKNSLNNIMTGLVGQLILTITGFVTRTVFINVLGSTYLGVSGLFSNILTVLSFAELGVGQAIVFSLYKPIAKKDEEKMRTFNMLVTSRRQKLISERERENSNAYVKTTNQY